MIPVKQQYLHDPANGIAGDCFRASLASILELDINEVPHFLQLGGGPKKFWSLIHDFLDERGLVYIEQSALQNPWLYKSVEKAGYHILSGMSPRGLNHAVVGYGGKIVFDPHPDNTGLDIITSYGFLIKRDCFSGNF